MTLHSRLRVSVTVRVAAWVAVGLPKSDLAWGLGGALGRDVVISRARSHFHSAFARPMGSCLILGCVMWGEFRCACVCGWCV